MHHSDHMATAISLKCFYTVKYNTVSKIIPKQFKYILQTQQNKIKMLINVKFILIWKSITSFTKL